MKLLRERKVVLELCPSSNVQTKAVESWAEMKHIVSVFLDRQVPITINTDGPYLLNTDMRREIELLLQQWTSRKVDDRQVNLDVQQIAKAAILADCRLLESSNKR